MHTIKTTILASGTKKIKIYAVLTMSTMRLASQKKTIPRTASNNFRLSKTVVLAKAASKKKRRKMNSAAPTSNSAKTE